MNFKKIATIVLIALPALVFSQSPINVTESVKNMSAGNQNCYVVMIPKANVKSVADSWKKYIRKDTKSKPEDNAGETRIIGGYCKNISAGPINIYAAFLETSDGVQVTAWISEADAFISTQSNADKSLAVQNYLRVFAVQEYKKVVQDQLAAEQSKQKDLEKAYEGFVKDQKRSESNIASYNKDIEKLQNKIKDEESNIQKAQANQANSRAEADRQKMTVQQVSDVLSNIK